MFVTLPPITVISPFLQQFELLLQEFINSFRELRYLFLGSSSIQVSKSKCFLSLVICFAHTFM